jgi:hypothetical protein
MKQQHARAGQPQQKEPGINILEKVKKFLFRDD